MQTSPGRSVPTILLVEDDDQVRGMIRSLLAHEGYSIIEAADGAAGLQAAQAQEDRIDMLLSDMLLPELSGFDLGEKLRAMFPDLKILFISGYVEGDIVQRSMTELGATFLDKPFLPTALLARVREAIGPARSASV